MNAYIFCYSRILNKEKIQLPEPGAENCIFIAADSGVETAFWLGVTPDVLIGDFDSADLSGEKGERVKNIKKIRHPAQKDDTDSMLAVKYALELGCKNITLIGGLDSRIDHTLANLCCLKYIKNRGAAGYITNGYNKITYMENMENSRLTVYRNYRYVSIVPTDQKICGVTLTGFKYPLRCAEVSFEEPYTVCNEIAEGAECGEIAILQGGAFVCECDEQN